MIKTSIILKLENNFPICHKSTGLAKNLEIARWMFEITGWRGQESYPGLSYDIEEIYWPESEQFFPTNKKTLWLLGHHVIMN